VKIGNSTYSLRIPKILFKKFKNISEKFIKLFLKNKHTIPTKPSTLLVEFDTIRCKKFFEASNNLSINLVHYGRRRPTIWNKESFSIVKNSNSLLVDIDKIYDKNLKNSVYQGQLFAKENLNKLLQNHEFFENYFSFKEYSLWLILKPFFVDLITKRFSEAISEIEITKKLFNLYNIKNILILSEHGFNEQIIIQIAKQQKISLHLLQHGVFFDTPESLEQNIFAGILPMDSDYFLTWGDSTKKYSIKSGIPSQKLKPLGSIFYDQIFENKQKNLHLESNYILFALAWPGKNQVKDLTIETLESFEKSIKEICTIISNQNKKLIIKIHPYSEQEDLTTMIKKINPEIIIIKNGSILDLIQSCEIFITLDLSTTILEAQILEKPVISIIVRDTGLGNPTIFKDNSCIRIPVEELETQLSHLSDDDYRNKIILKGNDFVKKYLSVSNASHEILSYLQKS
jgi:hypothetical protein